MAVNIAMKDVIYDRMLEKHYMDTLYVDHKMVTEVGYWLNCY